MIDPDLHSLTGAYAANALPVDEEAAFESHLRDCSSCPQEVRELLATTARLGAALTERTPAGVRERVLAQAQMTRQLSPLDQPVQLLDQPVQLGESKASQRRGGQAAGTWQRNVLAMAASVLAVVSIGLGVVAFQADQRADKAARIAAVATDPRAVTVTESGPRGATAKLIAASDGAVFTVRNLGDAGEGRDYQLWVLGDNGASAPRSAGVLDMGPAGVSACFIPDVDPGETIAVTVEPRGGSESPTSTPLMTMRVEA